MAVRLRLSIRSSTGGMLSYETAPNGQRFLMMKMALALPGGEYDSQVVLNRERELLERVPLRVPKLVLGTTLPDRHAPGSRRGLVLAHRREGQEQCELDHHRDMVAREAVLRRVSLLAGLHRPLSAAPIVNQRARTQIRLSCALDSPHASPRRLASQHAFLLQERGA